MERLRNTDTSQVPSSRDDNHNVTPKVKHLKTKKKNITVKIDK